MDNATISIATSDPTIAKTLIDVLALLDADRDAGRTEPLVTLAALSTIMSTVVERWETQWVDEEELQALRHHAEELIRRIDHSDRKQAEGPPMSHQ